MLDISWCSKKKMRLKCKFIHFFDILETIKFLEITYGIDVKHFKLRTRAKRNTYIKLVIYSKS